MTCIVGLVHDGRVYMGADSLAQVDSEAVLVNAPKVFRIHNMLIATCGHPRFRQLLQYSLEVEAPHEYAGFEEYLATTFVDAIRTCIKKGGYSRTDNGQEITQDDVLIGAFGGLFRIDEGYNVIESQDDYHAIGSGKPVAQGALYAAIVTKGHVKDWQPRTVITMALSAAQHHTTSVRGPYTILCEPPEEGPAKEKAMKRGA